MSDESSDLAEIQGRAETLLQRFLDHAITQAEATELLSLWDRCPDLEIEAKANFETDRLFRFSQGSRAVLSPQQLERLDAFFKRSTGIDRGEKASVSLLDNTFDFDSLIDLAAKSPMLPQAAPPPPAPVKPAKPVKAYDPNAKGSLIPLRYLVPLMLLVFGVFVFREWRPVEVGEDRLADRLPTAHAILTDMTDVQWTGGTKTLRRGDTIYSESLSFESGTIELLFYNGVRGVVEGPAEIALLGEKQVFCRRGKWSVTVPKQGRGFEIQAPHCTVRDLGTRFYTDVSDRRCDVHVLDGLVELDKPGEKTKKLALGQAASVTPAGPVVSLPSLSGLFVLPLEMRRRSDAALFRGNRPEADEIRRRKSTAVRTLDFAKNPSGAATLFGGEIVDGSEPDTKAFRFTGPEDRIRLRPAGELDTFSVFVRLQLDRLNRERNPVLMSEGSKKNGLVWHVTPDGKMIVGVRYQSTRTVGIFQTPVVFTANRLGRPVDLALVVDGSKQSMTVYFEGNPILIARLPRPAKWDLNELDVGSWSIPESKGRANYRIDGSVEHVLLFDRTLKPEEIRLLQQ